MNALNECSELNAAALTTCFPAQVTVPLLVPFWEVLEVGGGRGCLKKF